VVSYTYDPAVQNSNADVLDAIPVVVTDVLGNSTPGSLDITITDSKPVAQNDANAVTEDTALTASGNVLLGAGADTVGADANATPVTPASLALTYGNLVLNSDGSYTYTLNNADPAVNALNNGQTLTDSYTYTLTDGDGSSTTATLTITINGHTDGVPTLDIPDTNNPGAGDGDKTVAETDGPMAGSFTITAPAGLGNLTVGGETFTPAQLADPAYLAAHPINTGEGVLVITGYNPTTGVVSYTYDPAVQNSNADVLDAIPVVVTDVLGNSTPGSLDITITDSKPVAQNDANAVTEDTALTASGNVLLGAGADTVGADANATPVTPASLALTYGNLVLNSDGSYTYTLNNADPAVNALNNGQTLTDSYTYTLTDGDGSSTTATLTITINGHTDGVPTLDIPDTNNPGAGDGDKTVAETDGPMAGSFTITAPAGLGNLTVGGETFTPAQLADPAYLAAHPINTGEGVLVITGYNPTTGVVSYTYDPAVQNSNADVLDAIPVVVTDVLGNSTPGSLDITITDSKPVAQNDANAVTEDTALTASGNVLLGAGADTVGADANATPVTPASLALTYGNLVLNSDGSYTYTLNNADPAVNALNNGQTLTDSYTYTLTDGDGSSTTATLTITINGHTDGVPTLDIPDTNNPGAGDGDKTVAETDGPMAGSFTITAPAGLGNLTVGGETFTPAQLADPAYLAAHPINTGEGVLVITGYNPTTGVVSYTYDPAVQNSNADVLDAIPVVVTDVLGNSTPGSLDITITDSKPVAQNDANAVTEDTALTASGNVLLGAGADTVGADANATPVTPASLALTYGNLVLNSDGSYTYTLNNADPAVNALNNGQTLTDSYTYTLTDGDGSSTTATLTITINGHTDGVPTLDIPDTNNPGAGDGDKTVAETDGPMAGSFTITAPAGLGNLTVGGETFTPAQLADPAYLAAHPINTGEGVLVITGYNPTTGVVSYTYDPAVQNSNADVLDAIPVVVTDVLGNSTPGSLDITITDSKPVAQNDANAVTEDTALTASGNVLLGAGADTVGADANATPVTPASLALTYGNLVLNSDGSYTYTLNNADPAVNALNNGQTLTDSYTYTLTDGDGSSTTATLTITINGHTDGVPTIVPVDGNAGATGQATVNEVGLLTLGNTTEATTGTISVSAPDGLISVTVGGTTLTAAQLAALGTTPVTINSGEGSLVLTGYNAGTGALSYTYTLLAAQNQPSATESVDNIALSVLDAGGATSNGTLSIQIVDSTPTAVNDAASVAEDGVLMASGNVFAANDSIGADVRANPVTAASPTLTYGSLVLNTDGSYTYTLNNANPAVNALNNGQTLTDSYTYTITDNDSDTSTATLTITINGSNDSPVVGVASVSVSEEGLLNGLADSTGDPSDTTNLATQTGTISVVDPDSALTVTLSGPAGITAGGVAVSWSGNGTSGSPLIGTAGGTEVFRATIDSNGNYTVSLSKAIDHPAANGENLSSFNLTVSASDGVATATGTLAVTVEDDAPTALASTQVVTLPSVDTNLMLVLDISGSMGAGPGSRLDIMKQSVTQMLDQYDNLGDVMVRVVTFSSSANAYQNVWVSVADAKTYVNGLGSGGTTNYDAALLTAMSAFNSSGKIAGAQNVSYFLTDGAPNGSVDWNSAPWNYPGTLPNQTGIQSGEEAIWTNFLQTNQINSMAFGMGTGATTANMDPVAYNGTTATDTGSVVVANIADLPPILRDSIVVPAGGDLTQGSLGAGSALGADGGDMASFSLDGTTYSNGGVVTGTNRGTYNATTNTWTVQTVSGGKLVVDMDNGQYTYTPVATTATTYNESVGYTLRDFDGDTASATLTITVNPPQVINLLASGTTITGLNMGLSGEYFGYNDNRDGTVADPAYQGATAVRLHADDGTADAGTANNVDRLADVEAIIEGRNGNANLINNAVLSNPLAADATFSANKIEFGLPAGSTTPLFSNDLGQNGKVTTGAIGATATVGGANNLNTFLKVSSGNADGLAATSGLGDTTDAIVRMVGYIYIPAGGVYDLRITADDGYRVLIGGQNVAQADFIQSTATQTYTGVTIGEGMQAIEILYWDQGGHASLRIEVKQNGAADSTYKIIGNDDYALFSPTDVPVLASNQDIVETGTNGVYEIRTGGTYSGDGDAEKVNGSAGKDSISGGGGNDILNGGDGSDWISGGAGSDKLSGGLGSDTFAWTLADQGSAATPATDTIIDFNTASKAAGGDVLDLRDLLSGTATTAATLDNYLDFAKSGSDTVINVHPDGVAGSVTQKIVLTGVDLTANSTLNDQAIIQDLLTKGKLITD
jgi:T1SS-143 domain-containing protein